MKNFLISLITFLCGATMATHAQIPNPGFENWTGGNPDGWATSNVISLGLVNITQTSDYHSGASALRGEVVTFGGNPIKPVIQSGTGGTGFPISEQYHSFELYYKLSPIGGDKFSVNVNLEKAGNIIAEGVVSLPDTVSTYTYLSVPLNYITNDVPDLANIQISITGPITGPDVHPGSVMFIDDLSFSSSAGTEDIFISGLIRKSYPNPTVDIINIPLNETVSGEVILTVFDTYGKVVKKTTGHAQQSGSNIFQFSVENLPSGIYFYSINGENNQYHGKFTVSR